MCREFEDLLHDKAPLEAYTDWLQSMVNRCIILVRLFYTFTDKPPMDGSARNLAPGGGEGGYLPDIVNTALCQFFVDQ